jgi:adenylate cyclase
MSNFFKELKRRKVYTIAVAYIVIAWALLQVADTILPIYDFPDWVLKSFTTFLFLGFPLALVLAWVYDITRGGLVKTGAAPNESADVPVSLPSGPSIAVLPFRNLSGENDQDLFAQALTGDIISGLTQSSNLFVLTAGATAGMEQGEPDIQVLGTRLGVSYLLKGSVQKAGGTLRVSALLMDTANGVQIWSQNYDRELSAENLFGLQDDIREQIVATLSDLHGVIYSTHTQKNVHRPTNNLNAYECLSVALAYDKYISGENHLRARESLEHAVEIDPQFDSAWAHLSWLYTDEHVYGFNPLPDPMGRALAAAQKGVQLAPGNYHNHWLLSRVHYFMGNRDLFLAEAHKALKLNSSDGTTLGLIGMYIAWAGEWGRGIEMMSKAKLLNPNFPDYYYLVDGSAAFAKGDYAGALKQSQKANLADFSLYQMFLTASYALLDRGEDATLQLEKLMSVQPGITQEAAFAILQRTFPFQPKLVETLVAGLARAGLAATKEATATPGSVA